MITLPLCLAALDLALKLLMLTLSQFRLQLYPKLFLFLQSLFPSRSGFFLGHDDSFSPCFVVNYGAIVLAAWECVKGDGELYICNGM